jgi:hypothetical protein
MRCIYRFSAEFGELISLTSNENVVILNKTPREIQVQTS